MTRTFLQLMTDLRRISAELLPPHSPVARYSDNEVLRILSFRLFAHAEIEGFVESVAESMVDALSVKNDRNILRPAVRDQILYHHMLTQSYPPRTLVNMPTGQRAQKAIRGVLNAVQDDVGKNNGVSEKDLLKLFLPLGVPIDHFNREWLRSMNELARARGEVAHNSWNRTTTVQQPTPQGERQRLVRPLWGLQGLVRSVQSSI
ncbi:HEPN domain-containing protein [Modestobacter sp. NPDC049651]|uniref:HEPN domain-containing protein n=1 Tax=unclassified Modestobacter TaxID=2643866 RepID=UPI0033CBC421